jgi:hypothetical protein
MTGTGQHHDATSGHREAPGEPQEGINEFENCPIFNSKDLKALPVALHRDDWWKALIGKHKAYWT